MRALRIHIVLLFALCSSCSRDGKIDGQIFIVTKGRENLKLALVDIRAIRESDFSTYWRSTEKNKQDELQAATSEYDRLRPTSERAQAELEDAQKQCKAAAKTVDATFSNIANFDKSTNQKAKAAYDALAKQRDSKQEAFKAARATITPSIEKVEALRSEVLELRAPGSWLDHHFASLPQGITSAISDSEGKFTLRLPRRGRFLLAAKTSRSIFQTEEQYCWLVWVSLDGQSSKSLILANHNLASTIPPGAIVSP